MVPDRYWALNEGYQLNEGREGKRSWLGSVLGPGCLEGKFLQILEAQQKGWQRFPGS